MGDTPERLHLPPGGSTSEVSFLHTPEFKVATFESGCLYIKKYRLYNNIKKTERVAQSDMTKGLTIQSFLFPCSFWNRAPVYE